MGGRVIPKSMAQYVTWWRGEARALIETQPGDRHRRQTCTMCGTSNRTGQHVLVLGLPGLAFGSLSMYSGVVSGRLRTALTTGKTLQGHPVTSNVELVRVQMPISPGLSGAPVVDDENRAIGVVTSAGAWSQDLEFLLEWERLRESRNLPMPIGSLDLPTLLGELAETFHDYGSPGYGDAVPMRYPKTAPVAGQPPPTHAH